MEFGKPNPFRKSPERYVDRAIRLQQAWQRMLTPMVFVEDGKPKVVYTQQFSGLAQNRAAEKLGDAMYRNDQCAKDFAVEQLGVVVANALELAPYARLSEQQGTDLEAIKEFRERQDS